VLIVFARASDQIAAHYIHQTSRPLLGRTPVWPVASHRRWQSTTIGPKRSRVSLTPAEYFKMENEF